MNKKLILSVPILSVVLMLAIWLPTYQHSMPVIADSEIMFYAPEKSVDTDMPTYRSMPVEEARTGFIKVILDIYKEIVTAITISFNAILAFRQLKSKKDKK